MAHIVKNRVLETSTTTGTGDFTLEGAIAGYTAFGGRMSSPNDTCWYYIEGVGANGNATGEFESGLGTYSASNTLTRSYVSESSNSDALVSFSAGTKRVGITVPSEFVMTIGRSMARILGCY